MRRPGDDESDEGNATGRERSMSSRNRRWRFALAAGLIALAAAAPAASRAAEVAELLRFGTDMARAGNWREARFRWERALKDDPGDARIVNNLAVAHEALGAAEEARALFDQALQLAPNDRRIRDNSVRSSLFWRSVDTGQPASAPPAPLLETGKPRKGRDAVEVPVTLPLPARLRLDGAKTLLVASFLSNDSELLDVNRELVRFLRGEFRKYTAFQVLDVSPPPAVPEQTLDDMAKNAEFFRWLGREHGADVVITGAMRYSKRDASGFQDFDYVSELTGQKIRQTQFVEQEEFTFELDVLYFRGADGSLLFRDRMRRQAVFQGAANDPISAFYELGNTIAADVLSVISPRTRQDVRYLFK